MKVGIFRNTDGACDLYRASLPIGTATKNRAIKSSELWTANLLYDVSRRTDKFMETMASDIYLIQRLSGYSLMKKIKEFMRETGLKAKIVIDHDDDVFNVSPLSDHYVDYGTNEARIVHNGSVIHEWRDGANIDIKENIKRMDEIKGALSEADLVTVTTDHLREAFLPYNNNVKVLPNCVNLTQWNRLPIERKDKDQIRICWAGGHSHWEDLFLIRNALIETAKRYPNVRIVMVGYKPPGIESTFLPGQVEFHEWVETPAHPYRLAALDIDIAVIPLKDTIFNRRKSAIKWIEFSALGIPSVSSYISPYKEMADLDGGNNGFYVENNDTDSWIKALSLLIEDRWMRIDLGLKAHRTVEIHFDINTQYQQWVKVYEELLQCPSLAIQL